MYIYFVIYVDIAAGFSQVLRVLTMLLDRLCGKNTVPGTGDAFHYSPTRAIQTMISPFLWDKKNYKVRCTHESAFLTATQTAVRSSTAKNCIPLLINVYTDFGTLSKKVSEGFLVVKRV